MHRVEIISFAGGTYGVRVGTFATQQEAEGFKNLIEAALRDAAIEEARYAIECEYCGGECRHSKYDDEEAK
jgi:hypothetical protein